MAVGILKLNWRNMKSINSASAKAKKEQPIIREALYMKDAKMLVERKNLSAFLKLGADTEIEDEKKFTQAKGLTLMYFKSDKSVVTALCDTGKLAIFKKAGGSETKPAAKKEDK